MLSRRAILVSPALACAGQEQGAKMFGNAESYERFMGRWSRLLAPQLVEFARVGDMARVLDVGSGTGSLAFAVLDNVKGSTVTGIDPSREYVAYASRENRFGSRAVFEVGDAQQLRFADSSFDACLSLLVFNFIPDPRKALTEVSRVTKTGCTVAAAVWDYGDGMRMLRTFWDATAAVDPDSRKVDESDMPLSKQGALGELWKKGGLRDVTEKPLEFTMQFSSFADYWEPFLQGQGPAGAYVRKLNDSNRQRLREELKRRLRVTDEPSPLALPARAWAVRGIVAR